VVNDMDNLQPLVTLVEQNSCAHALVVAFDLAILVHLWMGAATSRKHAHASTGRSFSSSRAC
jgi:hypothetical protein